MKPRLLLLLTLGLFAWHELDAATPTPTPTATASPSRRRSPSPNQVPPSQVKPTPLPLRTAPPIGPSAAPQRTAIPKPTAAQLSPPPAFTRRTPAGPSANTRVPDPSANDNRLVKGKESRKNFNAGTALRTLPRAVVPQNKKLTEIKPSAQPVTFQKFELLDPETGKTTRANGEPFTADSIITLPNGKTMKAGEYYEKINQIEADFAKRGRSLRQLKAAPPDTLTKEAPHQRARKTMTPFTDPVVNDSLRVKQAGAVKSIHRPLKPGSIRTPLDSVVAEKPTSVSSAAGPSAKLSLSVPDGVTARILTTTTQAELMKAVQESAQVRRANLETSFKSTTEAVRQRVLMRKKEDGPKPYVNLGKLLIFTSANGSDSATANTTLSGDIKPGLGSSATAGNAQFALRWELASPAAKATEGTLKVTHAQTGAQVGSVPVTIAANQTSQNLYFQFPSSAKPGPYVAAVYVAKTTSSKVSVNYTAEGPGTVTLPPDPYAEIKWFAPFVTKPAATDSPPMGDPGLFSAYFKTSSNLSYTSGYHGKAILGAYVLGVDARAVTGDVFVGLKTGGMSATAKLLLFDQAVYEYGYDSGGKPMDEVDESREEQFVYPFSKDYEYTFTVGIIPITVQCSLAGEAGFGVIAHLKPADQLVYTNVVSSLNVWVDAKAFVNLEVAGGGFYGHLSIMYDIVTYELDTVNKVTRCYNDLDALQGEFGLFAFAYLPAFNIPPWKLHEWYWPWVKWDSPIHDSGDLFNTSW